MNKLNTLFGHKTITVNIEPVFDQTAEGGFRTAPAASWTVRQIPLGEYQAFLGLLADEFSFNARICGKTKPEILQLKPESYELVNTTVREVNEKGFFTWSARQTKRGTEEIVAFIEAGMDPQKVIAMFQTMAKTPSPLPLSSVPPLPA